LVQIDSVLVVNARWFDVSLDPNRFSGSVWLKKGIKSMRKNFVPANGGDVPSKEIGIAILEPLLPAEVQLVFHSFSAAILSCVTGLS
jgi:hypothetical protein